MVDKKTLVKGEDDWFSCRVNFDRVVRVSDKVMDFMSTRANQPKT